VATGGVAAHDEEREGYAPSFRARRPEEWSRRARPQAAQAFPESLAIVLVLSLIVVANEATIDIKVIVRLRSRALSALDAAMTSPHRTQIAERVKHRIAEALGASEVVVHIKPA